MSIEESVVASIETIRRRVRGRKRGHFRPLQRLASDDGTVRAPTFGVICHGQA